MNEDAGVGKGRWAESRGPGKPHADTKVDRWLEDLRQHGADAAFIVSKGRHSYEQDSLEGRLLRNAAERVLINVATVAARLPESFTAGHPGVDWRGLQRMRNLVAHHYDKVASGVMWSALTDRIPDLLVTLGLEDR
ncbi:MAG: DUF86 domain-containing protein [Micropruina sp.]|nr:DUF86 domain-containing protein [Micropruina sp.]